METDRHELASLDLEKPSKAAPEKKAQRPRPRKQMPSPDEIYERMVSAIFEHRLAPGTKLVEDRLALIFGVSRSRIRPALARLAHEKLVRLEPNRGAFVAAPTPEEAREIFEARRLIEPGVMRRLVETVDARGVDRLRTLVREEAEARAKNDRRAIIRMSGDFHIAVAEMAGNAFLARTMRELATLTCLIIFLYDAPHIPSCHGDEHQEIVDAIAARDGKRATSLMLRHLEHVEGSLELRGDKPMGLELEQIFV
jgi:DNA-binding GntR family transcriptional regulator